jgi:hypothetical protein
MIMEIPTHVPDVRAAKNFKFAIHEESNLKF